MRSPGRRARRRRGTRATGLVLALSVLVAGCGGGSAKPKASAPKAGASGTTPSTAAALVATGPQRQACSLLTQAEVEAAVGGKTNAPRPSEQATAGSGCSFTLAAGPDQAILVASTTSPGSPAAFDAARARANPPAQTVSAGDKAFVAGGQAVALKGSTLVTVVVATKQAAAAQTQTATRLIQAAAARV